MNECAQVAFQIGKCPLLEPTTHQSIDDLLLKTHLRVKTFVDSRSARRTTGVRDARRSYDDDDDDDDADAEQLER